MLTAPHKFAEFVAGHGVPFAGVDDGPMRLMDAAEGAGAVIEGGMRARLRQARTMPAMFTQVLEDCWAVASEGADADVVMHNGQIIAGSHVGVWGAFTAVLLAEHQDDGAVALIWGEVARRVIPIGSCQPITATGRFSCDVGLVRLLS